MHSKVYDQVENIIALVVLHEAVCNCINEPLRFIAALFDILIEGHHGCNYSKEFVKPIGTMSHTLKYAMKSFSCSNVETITIIDILEVIIESL